MAGREALQSGLIKRVVDGNNTGIWRDRWIANHFEGRPITPQDDQNVVMVADLLTESGEWNAQLIRDIFLPIDAEAIMKQPVGSGGHDFWGWDLEKCFCTKIR